MFLKSMLFICASLMAVSSQAFELQFSDLDGHFKGSEEGCEFKFVPDANGVVVVFSVNPGGSVHYFSQAIEQSFMLGQDEHQDSSIASFAFAPGTDSPLPWKKITSAVFKFESPDFISSMEFFTPGLLWNSRDLKCTDMQKL